MNKKGLYFKCALFVFIFVFVATLTLTTTANAGDDGCCDIPCPQECTPPTIRGFLLDLGHGNVFCVSVSISHECWNDDCMCA